LPLRKPPRANISTGSKRVASFPNRVLIAVAAQKATYEPSHYHCRLPDGRPVRARAKPASLCPRDWTIPEATSALRSAILKEYVSEKWEDGFPRYLWLREGEVIYEARHTRGPHGLYHAYPITAAEAPSRLIL